MALYITENTKNPGKNRTNREYHVQHNKYVKYQDVKIYCVTNLFPGIRFIGPHKKPHGVCGLGKNYHMFFNPKLGHGTCAMRRIPCDCNSCTSILGQPWVLGFPAQKQRHYQPIQDFT